MEKTVSQLVRESKTAIELSLECYAVKPSQNDIIIFFEM